MNRSSHPESPKPAADIETGPLKHRISVELSRHNTTLISSRRRLAVIELFRITSGDCLSMPPKPIDAQERFAFAGLAGLLTLSQMVGQEGASSLQLLFGPPALWKATLAAVVYASVAFVGYRLSRNTPRPDQRRRRQLVLLALLAVILSNLFPDLILKSLGVVREYDLARWLILAGIAILWIGLYEQVIPTILERYQMPINLSATPNPPVPSGDITLIALVSSIKTSEIQMHSTEPWKLGRDDGKFYLLNFKSVNGDVNALDGSRWPWQQLLRSVNRYLASDKVTKLKIVLVGSKDGPPIAASTTVTQGSFDQLDSHCKPLLERYKRLDSRLTVETHPEPLDYEDYNTVMDSIRDRLKQECESKPDMNVFVDITGGQKITSVAAAAATIGTNGQFQYVQTNPPYDVLVSDLHPQTIPIGS